MATETFYYDNKIVRNFAIATVIWGIVGMLVGIIIALKLIFPEFLGGIAELSYGRLRPLHTNAVIFAFAGNAIFLGVYYSLQRLCKARMWSDTFSKINFWGWQAIIVSAALTLPFGITQSKEYAELEWPIAIAIAVVWVVFGVNMIMTIYKRRVKHMYVAIWFYIATFVTVAVLHIFNNLVLPYSFLGSYSVYAGVQDALVQWWYGHNAVAFFLTTPFLGIMYYFIPKAANRPIYSYRLSIVHFWALIFIYIWAGPHHLLYTALPGWAQSLGVVFSVMLIAPSWGGMINGLFTLRGAWDRVRKDPVLSFWSWWLQSPVWHVRRPDGVFGRRDYHLLTTPPRSSTVIAHVHYGQRCLWYGRDSPLLVLYFISAPLFSTWKFHSLKLGHTSISWRFATLGTRYCYVLSQSTGAVITYRP